MSPMFPRSPLIDQHEVRKRYVSIGEYRNPVRSWPPCMAMSALTLVNMSGA